MSLRTRWQAVRDDGLWGLLTPRYEQAILQRAEDNVRVELARLAGLKRELEQARESATVELEEVRRASPAAGPAGPETRLRGGKPATEPSGARPATEPSGGSAAAVASGGQAATEPSDGRPAAEASDGPPAKRSQRRRRRADGRRKSARRLKRETTGKSAPTTT
ncbi:MAG: hypothetical protein GEU88_07865 [Solirubrobacterales bacterium]|nr:hypothetical protein [Solirubrobacterales bacterium]